MDVTLYLVLNPHAKFEKQKITKSGRASYFKRKSCERKKVMWKKQLLKFTFFWYTSEIINISIPTNFEKEIVTIGFLLKKELSHSYVLYNMRKEMLSFKIRTKF